MSKVYVINSVTEIPNKMGVEVESICHDAFEDYEKAKRKAIEISQRMYDDFVDDSDANYVEHYINGNEIKVINNMDNVKVTYKIFELELK